MVQDITFVMDLLDIFPTKPFYILDIFLKGYRMARVLLKCNHTKYTSSQVYVQFVFKLIFLHLVSIVKELKAHHTHLVEKILELKELRAL